VLKTCPRQAPDGPTNPALLAPRVPATVGLSALKRGYEGGHRRPPHRASAGDARLAHTRNRIIDAQRPALPGTRYSDQAAPAPVLPSSYGVPGRGRDCPLVWEGEAGTPPLVYLAKTQATTPNESCDRSPASRLERLVTIERLVFSDQPIGHRQDGGYVRHKFRPRWEPLRTLRSSRATSLAPRFDHQRRASRWISKVWTARSRFPARKPVAAALRSHRAARPDRVWVLGDPNVRM
jgi:hypothetical protein